MDNQLQREKIGRERKEDGEIESNERIQQIENRVSRNFLQSRSVKVDWKGKLRRKVLLLLFCDICNN